MLYKVTPMMAPPEKKPREPGQPRKKRKSAVFDGDGNEVLISLQCLKCKQVKPLLMFGLRRMADGAIRNQPWCRTCRSGAGAPRPKKGEAVPVAPEAKPELAAAPAAAIEATPTEPEAAVAAPEAEPAPAGQ
jgi:hypothetical protein